MRVQQVFQVLQRRGGDEQGMKKKPPTLRQQTDLGAGIVEIERVHEQKITLLVLCTEGRLQPQPPHALGQGNGVAVRDRTVRPPAAAPDGRADRAVSGPAGALLLPGLAPAAANLSPSLGLGRALPPQPPLVVDHALQNVWPQRPAKHRRV